MPVSPVSSTSLTRAEIDYFVELEAHQSFTSAAHALGISQPALTLAISKLEAKLGLRLFSRTAGGVLLTASGEELLPAARRARQAVRALEQSAYRVGEARLGTLRTVCRPTLMREPVARLVSAMHRSHPEIGIEMEPLGIGADAFDVIRGGLADVAVTTEDDNLDGVEVTLLGDIELVAIVPPRATLPLRPTVDDLAALGLLSMTGFGVISRAIARRIGPEAVAEATILRAGYHGLLIRLALRGRGVLFVPRRVGDGYRASGARVVRPLDPPVLTVVVATERDGRSPTAREFIAIAQREFEATSP
ncbi:LysR family transcriptional regulator [Cumulibacter manganitolerans]|uniref:LysR family transcriptional regulator n=1 Tax=Cumulibacter manganitolerans TaxID=1884992 RepID=UPI0012972A31|nr:LysR family transcriptional regulator [Cumulibacter manganitolerans]